MRLILEPIVQQRAKIAILALILILTVLGLYRLLIKSVYGDLQLKYIKFDDRIKAVDIESIGVSHHGPPPEEGVLLTESDKVFTVCFSASDGLHRSITFKTLFTTKESIPTIYISPLLVQYHDGFEVISYTQGLKVSKY